MKITISKDFDNTELLLEMNPNEQTVLDLKEKIADQNFGPRQEEQRLELNDKRLKNSHLLAHYKIDEKSIIVLKFQSASTSSSNSSTPSATSEDERENN
jgi:hypothetical protein